MSGESILINSGHSVIYDKNYPLISAIPCDYLVVPPQLCLWSQGKVSLSKLIHTYPTHLHQKSDSNSVLDWCVLDWCTGLMCLHVYWTGVLYVLSLDWCVVCTGLVCCHGGYA